MYVRVFDCVLNIPHAGGWRWVPLFFVYLFFTTCFFLLFCLLWNNTQHEFVKISHKFTVTQRKPNKCTRIKNYCLINPKISVINLCAHNVYVNCVQTNTVLVNLLIWTLIFLHCLFLFLSSSSFDSLQRYNFCTWIYILTWITRIRANYPTFGNNVSKPNIKIIINHRHELLLNFNDNSLNRGAYVPFFVIASLSQPFYIVVNLKVTDLCVVYKIRFAHCANTHTHSRSSVCFWKFASSHVELFPLSLQLLMSKRQELK